MTFVTVTYRSADEDQVNKSIQRTNYMRRETVSKSYYLGERAIVVGSGLAGLSAARALCDRFRQVVILDRDELPEHATPRPGVPQGKHPPRPTGRRPKSTRAALSRIRQQAEPGWSSVDRSGF